METVTVQIPAALYTEIYLVFGEQTSARITSRLYELVGAKELEVNYNKGVSSSSSYPRPGEGTVTGKVWGIADRILADTGKVDRAAVVEACLAEGINVNTASTQYSHWKKAQG